MNVSFFVQYVELLSYKCLYNAKNSLTQMSLVQRVFGVGSIVKISIKLDF